MGMRRAVGVYAATAFAVAAIIVAAGSAEATNGTPGTWRTTGSMATAVRFLHTATLLPNGEVLVAGGTNSTGELTSAELYNPASGTWSSAGSMSTARALPTATLLPNGEVLVAGGFNRNNGVLASAELYSPATGIWSSTGTMSVPRWLNIATLLPDGEVLVAGGQNSTGDLSSAELYNPATGTWSSTGSMSIPREDSTGTLLPNGEVLVASGFSRTGLVASAELYNPSTGAWSNTGSLSTARFFHTATLLPNGEVLVAGGQTFAGSPMASAELYNPAIGTWSSTGSMSIARSHHSATLLSDGAVLVAGGQLGGASAELYSPTTGVWSSTGSMSTDRSEHTATLLPNGEVLVAGGQVSGASAELYTPQAAIVDPSISAAGMPVAGAEGSPLTVTVATFADPDTAAVAREYSATIDWGDGSPTSTGVITGSASSFSVTGIHTYAEENAYSVTVAITDVDTPSNNATVTTAATISDAPLTSACSAPVTLGPTYAGPTATLTDANPIGTLTDFSATIDWGDGSSSAGTIVGPSVGPGPYTVSGAHTYTTVGPHTITTTIADIGGSTTTAACAGVFVTPSSTPACDIDAHGKITSANGDEAKFSGDISPTNDDEGDEDNGNHEGSANETNAVTYVDLGPSDRFSFTSDLILALTCTDGKSASVYGRGTVSGSPISGPVFYIMDLTARQHEANGDMNDRGDDNHHIATERLRLFGAHSYDSAQQRVRGGIDIEVDMGNQRGDRRRE
ncbi:MAG: hypothetical protein E6I86_08725 [Chloroflexi bacterium]|nr:MAG: hypothetical protein E6I86_08725 [Chloroflexota bacterium]